LGVVSSLAVELGQVAMAAAKERAATKGVREHVIATRRVSVTQPKNVTGSDLRDFVRRFFNDCVFLYLLELVRQNIETMTTPGNDDYDADFALEGVFTVRVSGYTTFL
jgi:hypothetical protein